MTGTPLRSPSADAGRVDDDIVVDGDSAGQVGEDIRSVAALIRIGESDANSLQPAALGEDLRHLRGAKRGHGYALHAFDERIDAFVVCLERVFA